MREPSIPASWGASRQAAPVRNFHMIPLSTVRSSRCGRPVPTVSPLTRKRTGSRWVTVEKDRRGRFEEGRPLFDVRFAR